MQTSPDLPTTVDFGNNLVNYIEVNPDDIPPKIPPVESEQESDKKPTARPPHSISEADHARRTKPALPLESYSGNIPQYLFDFDQAEDSLASQDGLAAVEKLSIPPSLPGFLGKPILNSSVPIKDDNSVLNMPSHTVLNHLATSSIKNNILAVSATTRYRHKVTLVCHLQ